MHESDMALRCAGLHFPECRFPDSAPAPAPPLCGGLRACWESPLGLLSSRKLHSYASGTFAGRTQRKSPPLGAATPRSTPGWPRREPAARGMAPGTPRPPSQGSIAFKDVAVDFTQEEWCLLDHSQKELYLEVMLENVQNLCSVGLPVPRENLISYFQQRKAPWLLEQKGPRSSCPEAETNFEVKEMTAKLSLFVKGSGPQRCMNEDPHHFILRQICNSNIKANKDPKTDCECDETAEKFSQYSVQNQNMKLSSGNNCCQDSKYRKCFPKEVELVQYHEKPPEMPMYQGNLGGMAFGYRLDIIRQPKSKHVKTVSVSDKGRRPFSQNSELTAHQIIYAGEKPYECKHCGKAFTERGTLVAHQTVHTGEKPYECTQCGKAFKRRDYLTAHQTVHTGEKPYECKQCGKAFTVRGSLAAHQRIHTGEKPYVCKQCEKAFTWKVSLAAHQTVHTGEKPYECKQCGKSFTQRCSLAVHQKIHTGEKPYECKQCQKVFTQSAHLAAHQRIHTGEKPFECTQCGKAFTERRSLAIHQTVHTGEKPYQCKQCGKAFTQRGSLAAHQRIHTGEKPYECKHCGKTFIDRESLAVHQTVHTGEKPYECKHCGKAFTVRSHLVKHQSIHIGEKIYECHQFG
uniref:Uncharacterized protein n=2 Tax=Monodelphis domestica TaxID=13616 RepID=K7E353_MONDO